MLQQGVGRVFSEIPLALEGKVVYLEVQYFPVVASISRVCSFLSMLLDWKRKRQKPLLEIRNKYISIPIPLILNYKPMSQNPMLEEYLNHPRRNRVKHFYLTWLVSGWHGSIRNGITVLGRKKRRGDLSSFLWYPGSPPALSSSVGACLAGFGLSIPASFWWTSKSG